MSSKEIAKQIIEQIPDYKMEYVVSFLRGFQLDDEIEDDLYCERIYHDYLTTTPLEDKETISLEDAAKIFEVNL